MDEKWRDDIMISYPNVQICHGALKEYDFDKLKEYACTEFRNYPTYNFWYANTEPSNHVERAIAKMMGYPRKHIEYWTRHGTANPVDWHVDGDEVPWRTEDVIRHGKKLDKEKDTQLSTTSYVLYIKLTDCENGELMVLPYNKYVRGRGLLDPNYQPLEGSPILKIGPEENMCVKLENNVYHKVAPILGGFRLSLVWSEWDFVPEGYKKHKHWTFKDDHVVPTVWLPNEHNYKEI